MTARDINIIREPEKQYMKIAVTECYVWKSAEALGNEYVLPYNPNPVNVARVTVSYVIRCEITETAEAI